MKPYVDSTMKLITIMIALLGAGAGGYYWYSTNNHISPESIIADNNGNVVVYTSANCEECELLERYLKRRDVAFTAYDINQSSDAFKQYQKLGSGSLPVTLVNKQMLTGFDRTALKSELAERVNSSKVVLYSRPGCGYCDLAREQLTESKVQFKEYNVEASSKAQREFEKLGGKGVPLTVFNGKTISGYSEAAFDKEISRL